MSYYVLYPMKYYKHLMKYFPWRVEVKVWWSMQCKTLVKAELRLNTRSLVEPSWGTICRALSSMSSFRSSDSSPRRVPLASPSSISISYHLSSCSSRVVMYRLIAESLSNPKVLQNNNNNKKAWVLHCKKKQQQKMEISFNSKTQNFTPQNKTI